jgi:hypothetical protein
MPRCSTRAASMVAIVFQSSDSHNYKVVVFILEAGFGAPGFRARFNLDAGLWGSKIQNTFYQRRVFGTYDSRYCFIVELSFWDSKLIKCESERKQDATHTTHRQGQTETRFRPSWG